MGQGGSISVLIAEDHQLVREALAVFLSMEPPFEVVAQAGDGVAALEAAYQHRPDVAIVDLGLPRLPGAEIIRRLKALYGGMIIIAISGQTDEAAEREAREAGADAFLPKRESSLELLQALHRVARERGIDLAGAAAGEPDETSELTSREREIVSLIASGMTSVQIAAHLGITENTARKHRDNLMRKLGLHNAAELTAFAMRRRLV